MMKCCFDKRVWIALGVLAAGLLIADPRAGWVALPVLAGLACPVSMLFMMRGMRRDTGSAAAPGGEPAAGAVNRAAEIARLRSEIELLKRHASGAGVPVGAVALPGGEVGPFGGAADPVAPAGRRAPG
jgi:Protein of unknown function (DUF2933)